ncbi:hypothetical protein [Planococcus sp. A6]|uniref:hypothetical protein n=1 Tax=Planococcus sp. A6 TaxID=2992760 RepID=UPI00237A5A73|nr:hypothetical protein [Planococcus sp. A6]
MFSWVHQILILAQFCARKKTPLAQVCASFFSSILPVPFFLEANLSLKKQLNSILFLEKKNEICVAIDSDKNSGVPSYTPP